MKDHLFLMESLTDVDDDLIAQADIIRPKRPWTGWVAAAAAVAVVVSTVAAVLSGAPSNSGAPADIDTYVNSFTTHPAPHFEQGYVGNPYSEIVQNSVSSSMLIPYRSNMTVRAVEILPDTYRTVGQQQGGFRLVRMEKVRQLNTEYSGKYFFCTMSASDAADLTKYDMLVIEDLKQIGHRGHVIYNLTQECLTAIDLPIVVPKQIFAFTDDVFDPSLWNTAEDMKYHSNNSQHRNYKISETPTLSEFENYLCKGNVDRIIETIYTDIEPFDPKMASALEYVRPFDNGIFVPSINVDSPYIPLNVLFRRYVNGYPTNEAIQMPLPDKAFLKLISTGTEKFDYDYVKEYGNKFTDEDLQNLPDLSAALEKVSQDFDAGLITPGHLKNWEQMKFIKYSIFGWYDKTDEGVYGIIRVSWCYHGYRENNAFDVFRDDQYFLVEQGSQTLRPIEHEEITAMGGGAYHFMPGQYGYDEYGRKNPPFTASY